MRFRHSTEDIMGNKMSQKEGEKTGILFDEVWVMWGVIMGGGSVIMGVGEAV